MKISGKFLKTFIFVVIGMASGFAYYYFIGCYGETCPIQSNPYLSTIYGGLLGFVLSGIFIKDHKEKDHHKKETKE